MDNLNFISEINQYTVIEKITEGYSEDDKYKLEKDGKYYLLRVGDKTRAPEKEQEFHRLMMYTDQDINTHKPIVFSIVDNIFYSIVSWVDGIPVMEIIKKDLSKDHYQLGKKVGTELRKLHAVSQYNITLDWKSDIEQKLELFLENYYRLNIEFTNSQQAIKYLKDNISLMSNRPLVALHGDFHWNNCVVDEHGNVGIIDFSGNVVGDPWYEFGGMLWALEYSDSFVNGQIDGYFETLPNDFWKVFKYYVALYAFEHLMYTNGTPSDIKNRITNASRMLSVFGREFALDVPVFRQ